jgi:hypothetical protein
MMAMRRARAIVFEPVVAWARIEQESGDPAFVLSRYVAVLALIPALFGFFGTSVLGVVVPGAGIVRLSLFNGVFGAIFGYVMTCITVLVLGLIIDLVAPWFGGRRDFTSAFKAAAYSFTPVWLAGVFLLLPGLRFLELAGCYGAYLLWLGLPRLMQLDKPRSFGFTALIVCCAGALTAAVMTVQALVFGAPGL